MRCVGSDFGRLAPKTSPRCPGRLTVSAEFNAFWFKAFTAFPAFVVVVLAIADFPCRALNAVNELS